MRPESSPATTQTMSDTWRTEIPARRAASGLDDAARMALPIDVRAKNRYRPTAMSGATTMVTIWDELRMMAPTCQLRWNGTG